MSDEAWRPLGVDSEEEISSYDALHDGVPSWMESSFWAWVKDGITEIRHYIDGSGRVPMLDEVLTEVMCQRLRITLPNLRHGQTDGDVGKQQLQRALQVLRKHPNPLQIADYLLANDGHAEPQALNVLLEHSKSVWEVGTRLGRPGLTRRVPLGVQIAANDIIGRAGQAGLRLAKAWENSTASIPTQAPHTGSRLWP